MKLSCLCGCIVNHIAFAVSLFVMTNAAFGCWCARLVEFSTLLIPCETDFIRPDYLPRKQ